MIDTVESGDRCTLRSIIVRFAYRQPRVVLSAVVAVWTHGAMVNGCR